jgi:hypothetical protein
MLTALKRVWSPGAFLLLAALLLSLYGMTRSSQFQTCLAQHHQYVSYQGEALSWLFRYGKVGVKCGADFIEHYHGPLTAIATLVLALFTITLWSATRGLLRHAPLVERGYVFGGCGDQRLKKDPQTGKLISIWVRATHGNYGKTPAFVERIAVEQCLEKDLPTRPTYTHFYNVKDALIPGIMGRPINNVEHEFPAVDHQIYYGRIFYRDVLAKEAHVSSFIYRFFADGHHEPMGDVHDDYWKWD